MMWGLEIRHRCRGARRRELAVLRPLSRDPRRVGACRFGGRRGRRGGGEGEKEGEGESLDPGRKVSDPRTVTRGNAGAAVVPRRGGRTVPRVQAPTSKRSARRDRMLASLVLGGPTHGHCLLRARLDGGSSLAICARACERARARAAPLAARRHRLGRRRRHRRRRRPAAGGPAAARAAPSAARHPRRRRRGRRRRHRRRRLGSSS